MPVRIELPESWGEARMLVTALAAYGYRFTEYVVLGRRILELE